MTAQTHAKPQESTQTQVIKDAAVYIPSSYLAQFLGVINAFLIRRLLGPTLMGIWATLQIILNYGGYLHLGSMQAGAKEIPYQIGRKDPQQAERIKNNIFSFSILMVSLGACLLIGGSLVFAKDLNPPIRIGLVAVALIMVGQRIYNFLIMLLRGHKNFSLLSKLTIVTAVLDVALTGMLVWSFGIYGLYGAVLGSLGLSILYAWKRAAAKVHWELDREVLRGLAKIGLPMLILGIVFTLLRTVDKILVVKYMGATQLGIYSVALMASNYVFGLSNMIGMLTLPRYSEKFGDKGDAGILGGYMDQTNEMLGLLLPVVLGALYFVAPELIRVLLPQYAAGIPAMQALLLGSFFLCLVHQPHNFLLAIGAQTSILPATIAGVVISFAFNYWAVRFPKDLTCVAAATSASYLVSFLLLFATASRHLQRKKSSWVPLAQSLIPFACTVALLLLLDFAFRGIKGWWVMPLQLALFGLAAIYPVRRVDRQTHLLRKAAGLFLERVRAIRA